MATTRRSSRLLTRETPTLPTSNYNYCLKTCIYRLVTQVEQFNAVTLKDLQTEIQQKTDLLDLVAYLGD